MRFRAGSTNGNGLAYRSAVDGPSVSRGRQPNILFIMADQMRADALGLENGWTRTPHLDRLAGEGVRCRGVITNSAECVPARISLATGAVRAPDWRLGERAGDASPDVSDVDAGGRARRVSNELLRQGAPSRARRRPARARAPHARVWLRCRRRNRGTTRQRPRRQPHDAILDRRRVVGQVSRRCRRPRPYQALRGAPLGPRTRAFLRRLRGPSRGGASDRSRRAASRGSAASASAGRTNPGTRQSLSPVSTTESTRPHRRHASGATSASAACCVAPLIRRCTVPRFPPKTFGRSAVTTPARSR